MAIGHVAYVKLNTSNKYNAYAGRYDQRDNDFIEEVMGGGTIAHGVRSDTFNAANNDNSIWNIAIPDDSTTKGMNAAIFTLYKDTTNTADTLTAEIGSVNAAITDADDIHGILLGQGESTILKAAPGMRFAMKLFRL